MTPQQDRNILYAFGQLALSNQLLDFAPNQTKDSITWFRNRDFIESLTNSCLLERYHGADSMCLDTRTAAILAQAAKKAMHTKALDRELRKHTMFN